MRYTRRMKRAYAETARNQLYRLATLTDVVYACGLVLVVTWFPTPEESSVPGKIWVLDLWAEYSQNLIAIAVALVFIIIYWLRSNTLLSALDRTDKTHTALSILSVFSLLLLLYMVAVGQELEEASGRAGQSVAMVLIGLTAGAAWWHARRKGLVRDGITKEEKVHVQIEAFSEPLAALVTLAFSWDELWWNFAWLSYIPIGAFLRKRGLREDAA